MSASDESVIVEAEQGQWVVRYTGASGTPQTFVCADEVMARRLASTLGAAGRRREATPRPRS